MSPVGPMGIPIYAETFAKLMATTISPPNRVGSTCSDLQNFPCVDIEAEEIIVTLVDSEDE